jgi:hypothetical protein
MFLILDIYGDTWGLYKTERQADDAITKLYKNDLDAGNFQQAKYKIVSVEIKETKETLF